MKFKIVITILILFCQTAFAQTKLVGQFEHKYFTDDGFGQIFNFTFWSTDSFNLNRFHEQKCYDRREIIKGLYKLKKDTLILITPISIGEINSVRDLTISKSQFIYSVDKTKFYSAPDLYEKFLNFYFVDLNYNLQKINPVETNRVIDTSLQNEFKEITYKFNIPKNVLYFIARREYDQATTFNESVTFDIADIRGNKIEDIHDKIYKTRIHKRKIDFDNLIEDYYFDFTFDKYIINKKGTSFKSLIPKYGPTSYLMTIKYDKK